MVITDNDIDIIKTEAKYELLSYLLEVAEKTGGSDVWRALFAEVMAQCKTRLDTLRPSKKQ